MSFLQILSICAVIFCICGMAYHVVRVAKLGIPNDFSKPSGSVKDGVVYSNTRAMMPDKKESAYLHLPAYTLGILFHLGIFASFLVFVLSFFNFFNNFISDNQILRLIFAIPSAGAIVCGIILFIQRFLSEKLKAFSTPDDHISMFVTTLFLLTTTLYLVFPTVTFCKAIYYISSVILFVYMPFGKLRHAAYFFAARFHLGFFYGRRNVWPDKEKFSK